MSSAAGALGGRRLAVVLALVLAACGTPPRQGSPAGRPPPQVVPPLEADGPPEAAAIPPDLVTQPDPVPQAEPRSRYGNPRSYTALGKTYRTLESAAGFRETGLASWYGRKFQGRRTSSGEPFDMFKLTAAHKTLPLPTYVRVTNLKNSQSIVVRVNDRGPFHKGRIIDLSYAAAAKLGMLGGPAMVEIEAVTPGQALPPPPPPLVEPPPVAAAPNYLQIAAYSDPINAVALREELSELGLDNAHIRSGAHHGDPIHRVLVGPFAKAEELTRVRNRLLDAGLAADPVSH